MLLVVMIITITEIDGSVITLSLVINAAIYTVSQKRDPDIIDCNFGKD